MVELPLPSNPKAEESQGAAMSAWEHILDVVEQPLALTALAIVATLVDIISHIPTLLFVGFLSLLGVHRSRKLAGKNIWGIQIPVYIGLAIVLSVALLGVHVLIRRTTSGFVDEFVNKIVIKIEATIPQPKPDSAKETRETPAPKEKHKSYSPSAEPSERAVLRVVGLKSNINGPILNSVITIENVGKYVALPPSFVWSAVKESPELPPGDEDRLFAKAPQGQKTLNKGKSVDAPDWTRGFIVAWQPWYPGDTKTLNVYGTPGDTNDLLGDLAALKAGDRGWYVLTRASFRDKIGQLPYRDSCTFFSLKAPDGDRCFTHND